MCHCSCRTSCRCVAPTSSQEIARVNNGEQIQVSSQYVLRNLVGAQNGLHTQDLQNMCLSMGVAMLQNISITHRDNAAALRATADAQRIMAQERLVMAGTQRAMAEERLVMAGTQRAMAEERLVMADTQRATAEAQRATAEAQRAMAEERLVMADTQRVTAEAQRATAEAQQEWFREVRLREDYQREQEEVRRRLVHAPASGNVQVGLDEAVINSIGQNDVDLLRTTVQAGENEARSITQQNPDPNKTYWEAFKELSNLEKGVIIAALAVIIGVVGWGCWTWVVPWVWPKLLLLVEMVKANAPHYVFQLLNFLFNQAAYFLGSGDLQSSVVTFVNSGYYTAAHYLVPGFGAMLAYSLMPNTAGIQN